MVICSFESMAPLNLFHEAGLDQTIRCVVLSSEKYVSILLVHLKYEDNRPTETSKGSRKHTHTHFRWNKPHICRKGLLQRVVVFGSQP